MVEVSNIIAYEARKLMRDAVAKSTSLSALDAIHLASALWVYENINKVEEFHTFDVKLLKYSGNLPFLIKEPSVQQPSLGLTQDTPTGTSREDNLEG